MSDKGYLKIPHTIKGAEWFSDMKATQLYIHLALTATVENGKWERTTEMFGFRHTKISTLARELEFTPNDVLAGLETLEKSGDIVVYDIGKQVLVVIGGYCLGGGV